jgi:S1-C subfamily serine protease
MLPPASAIPPREDIKTVDPPTGLALVTVSRSGGTPGALWTPERLDVPRYFFAATPAASRPAVAPVYVSSLEPQRSPAWSTEIWRVPAASGLIPGALVFTATGEWLGIAANENGESLIVPPAALFDVATQLSQPRNPPGELGFQVQHLDATLASEIGVHAGSGVIIAWVDPRGPAAKALEIGDVIEEINGASTPTAWAWHVRASRLGAGAKAALKVRRAGELRDITISAATPAARSTALGLTLVRVPGLGSRITQVVAHTAGERAGLQVGDIVTIAGDDADPSPALVRRMFEEARAGGAVLLTIRSGDTYRLVVLKR